MAALGVVTATAGAGASRTPATAQTAGPLAYLGQLENPSKSPQSTIHVVAVDPDRQRLYAMYNFADGGGVEARRLAIYDMASPVPALVGTRRLRHSKNSQNTPNTITLSPSRGRLFSLASGPTTVDSAIAAVDFEPNPARETVWDMASRVPGFVGAGITYSAEDDRLYVVGEMAGTYYAMNLSGQQRVVGTVPTVVAVDPDDGTVLWWRHVPECGGVLTTQHYGGTLARSSPAVSPRLVFACGTSSTGLGDTTPGQAGVVELHITPTAGPLDAPGFDVGFHPISGSYYTGSSFGFAVYDRGSDRLFVQSLSNTTPGAWVFDARLGGWAGFITGPITRDNGILANENKWGGVNEGNGHYYMGGSGVSTKGAVLVADGRASPPQNGVLADTRFAPQGGRILADAAGDRLFIPRGTAMSVTVARDLTTSAELLGRPDYDAQTDDIDETPGTFVSFTGDSAGFGARVVAVGDTAALTGPLPVLLSPAKIGGATRGVLFARVPGAGVQPAGAAAAAQAASSDTTTGPAVENGVHVEREDVAVDEDGLTVKQGGVAWPFEPRTCLDGGEGVDSPPAETIGGRAEVRCTLAAYESTASARQAAVSTGPVSIGDTRVDTRVKRTAQGGMANVVTSSTAGLRVEVLGVGSLEIGQVEAKATTSAHGRSGTAKATWTRSLSNVVVRGVGGTELFRSDGCSTTVEHDGKQLRPSGDAGTCDALADTVRKLLQVRVRLVFPTAEVKATPRGAFSTVGQTEADAASAVTVDEQGKVFAGDTTTRRAVPGLQVNVYNDSTERSRYIVQLAGLESSALYTVNRELTDEPCDMTACIPGGYDGLPPDDITGEALPAATGTEAMALPDAGTLDEPAGTETAARPRRRNPSAAVGGLDGLVFARRDLADGGLMASFLVLVAAAAAVVTRRRRLLDALAR